MKQSSAGSIAPALAGEARRKPKAMIGVDDYARPFLDYLLYNIEQAGYEEVVIVVGERDDSITHYYDREGMAGQFPSLRISYAVQRVPHGREKPLGTADALLCALNAHPSWRSRRFTVCNSDNLYSLKALQLLLEDSHPNAMIDYDRATLQFDEERIAQFAVIVKDADGFLCDIVEKPSLEQLHRAKGASGRVGVSMNIWRFSYDDILPYLERIPVHPTRQEKELPLAVKMMVAEHPHSVYAIPLAEHVIDLTSQADLPAVKEYLKKNFSHFWKE
jgi:NDP-sugar pyrophosphorylase family protein